MKFIVEIFLLNVYLREFACYERHPKSVRTVWGVRAAVCDSISADAGSAGSESQFRLYLKDLAPEAPPSESQNLAILHYFALLDRSKSYLYKKGLPK